MTSRSGEDPAMTNVLGRTSVGFERGFNDQQTELTQNVASEFEAAPDANGYRWRGACIALKVR
jgi:hypothetical protein